jgi:putative ABC transport system permease protein
MIPMTATAPMLGRIFTEQDDKPGAPKTTVLTYEFWQQRLHGEPGILGRDIRIDDEHFTVIGVMPPHYGLWSGDLYLPFQLNPANPDRQNRRMWVSALVRRGISDEQVNARLAQTAHTWEHDYAGSNPEYRGLTFSTWNIKDAVIAGARPVLQILMAAVALIVLISCANIGNLLLARASGRRREIALRSALGAPRLRIVRQLLTESLLLSLAGGALGVLLAVWGVPAAVALAGEDQLPHMRFAQMHLDSTALLVAIAVATLMGVLFGCAPALHSVKGDVAQRIREGGLQSGSSREARWVRGGLVMSQIALAMIVLAGTGLMLRTYRELLRLDLGYNLQNALTMHIVLPGGKYPNGEKITSFYDDLIARLRATPGIDGAAVGTGRGPLMDRTVDIATQDFYLAGHEGEKNVPNANFRVVTPGYFDVAGVRLLRGRSLSETDTAQSEAVAVINQTMAKLYWPKQDAVGQSIRLGNHYNAYGAGPDAVEGRWVKIVGVVADARQVRVLEVPVRQEIFFPVSQRPEIARGGSLILRSRLAPEAAAGAVRRVVVSIDPDRPVFDVTTLQQAVSDSFGPKRMATVLLGFFAVVAVTLASVGLYAIVAYSVAQRTRDIGIRMALGARASDVLRLILGEGWRLGALGMLGGIAAALLATRLMRTLVYGVSPNDPLTFVLAGVLLGAVVLAACYIPARRATRIDPMVALRYE